MGLPTGYELTAPTLDEFDAVAGLIVVDDLDVAGDTILGADFVRGEWSRTGFDLGTDAWIVRDRARAIVGYGQVTRGEAGVVGSWGVVHPEHRGAGIGISLLDRIDERASELLAEVPSLRFRHAINANDQAAAAMLRARGLRPVHHFWHMQIDLVDPFVPGRSPPGIEIEGIDPREDLPIVHAVLDEAFAEDRSHHPAPLDRWVEEEAGSPSYDPTLWLLARDTDAAVGALTASVAGDRGWVDYLAVLASHRGRGLGAALLRRSFEMLSDRGLRRVLVSVDAENPTGATRLYERVGMRVIRGWDLWERVGVTG
jgi:mycothiol synthase